MMDLRKLQRLVVDALEDVKAQDIVVFDTTQRTSEFERVIIASGTSNRQTRALANHVYDKVREHKAPVLSVEGLETGEWVLVDLGIIVVHVMQPAIRQYYHLEEVWGGKTVRVKLAGSGPARGANVEIDDEAESDPTPRPASAEPKGRGSRPALAGRAPRRKTIQADELAPANAPIDTTPLGYDDEYMPDSAPVAKVPRARTISPQRSSRPSTRKLAAASPAKRSPARSTTATGKTGSLAGTRRRKPDAS